MATADARLLVSVDHLATPITGKPLTKTPKVEISQPRP
jgi:hypothetical protein